MTLGRWVFLEISKNLMAFVDTVKRSKNSTLFGPLYCEDQGTTLHRNVVKCPPYVTALHSRRSESLASPLRESTASHSRYRLPARIYTSVITFRKLFHLPSSGKMVTNRRSSLTRTVRDGGTISCQRTPSGEEGNVRSRRNIACLVKCPDEG